MGSRPILPLLSVFAVTLAACGTQAADGSGSSECVVHQAEGGDRRWRGEPAEPVGDVADRLQRVADQHHDEASGVAFCSDYGAVEIFVTAEGAAARSAIAEIQADAPDVPVLVRTVRYSLEDLLAEQRRMRDTEIPGVTITGVGPDIENDGLRVELRAPSPAEGRDVLLQRGPLVEAAEEGLDIPIPLRFAPAGTSTDAG